MQNFKFCLLVLVYRHCFHQLVWSSSWWNKTKNPTMPSHRHSGLEVTSSMCQFFAQKCYLHQNEWSPATKVIFCQTNALRQFKFAWKSVMCVIIDIPILLSLVVLVALCLTATLCHGNCSSSFSWFWNMHDAKLKKKILVAAVLLFIFAS